MNSPIDLMLARVPSGAETGEAPPAPPAGGEAGFRALLEALASALPLPAEASAPIEGEEALEAEAAAEELPGSPLPLPAALEAPVQALVARSALADSPVATPVPTLPRLPVAETAPDEAVAEPAPELRDGAGLPEAFREPRAAALPLHEAPAAPVVNRGSGAEIESRGDAPVSENAVNALEGRAAGEQSGRESDDFARNARGHDARPQEVVRESAPAPTRSPSLAPVSVEVQRVETPAQVADVGRPEEVIPARVTWLASRGGGSARLQLNPPELGEVEVSVRVRGTAVEVQVRAEEPAAQLLVAESRERLVEALATRELRMESFQVRGGDDSGHGREAPFSEADDRGRERGGSQRERSPGTPAHFETGTLHIGPAPEPAHGSVDLRV